MVELLPCPFCSAAMRLRKHTAFHPENDCWLATSGDYGQPLEIAECDYAAWNRRSVPATQEAVERVARAIRRYKLEQSWPTATEEELAAAVDLDWECDEGEARAALAASGHAPAEGFVGDDAAKMANAFKEAGFTDDRSLLDKLKWLIADRDAWQDLFCAVANESDAAAKVKELTERIHQLNDAFEWHDIPAERPKCHPSDVHCRWPDCRPSCAPTSTDEAIKRAIAIRIAKRQHGEDYVGYESAHAEAAADYTQAAITAMIAASGHGKGGERG